MNIFRKLNHYLYQFKPPLSELNPNTSTYFYFIFDPKIKAKSAKEPNTLKSSNLVEKCHFWQCCKITYENTSVVLSFSVYNTVYLPFIAPWYAFRYKRTNITIRLGNTVIALASSSKVYACVLQDTWLFCDISYSKLQDTHY